MFIRVSFCPRVDFMVENAKVISSVPRPNESRRYIHRCEYEVGEKGWLSALANIRALDKQDDSSVSSLLHVRDCTMYLEMIHERIHSKNKQTDNLPTTDEENNMCS